MKQPLLFLLILFLSFSLFAQDKPQTSFEDLITSAELNINLREDAQRLTSHLDIPHTIYLPEGIFIEALGVENNKVVYAVYNDMLDIYKNGETLFWEEVESRFNLSNARLHYVNRPTQNPTLGYPVAGENSVPLKMLMVTDWTIDGVQTCDATNGDLLNSSFIVDPTNLASPKEANLAPWGKITVSDQINDGVMEYDTSGTFIRFHSPAGGVNNNILNNVRGHNFRSNGNMVVCNSDGNPDAVAEFDSAGNFLGNFIASGAGGMDSPFDIIFRTGDVLVSASSSDAVHRFDLNGTYLDNFVTGINFPQQVFEMPNGNIAVAGFSVPSGIYIYSPAGNLLKTLNVITGNRSVYLLPNGNILTTNGTGLHEIDSTSGALIRTIINGSNLQYVSLYDYSIIPVELVSFAASVNKNNVTLNWETATELNNSGFEIERSKDKVSFTKIGFVPGYGTTQQPKDYSFLDENLVSGKYYYRLKQIDLDGTFSYSGIVETDVTSVLEFALNQNYPNPFNPSTSIQFRIPENSFVTLKVYDSLGKEVANLLNENKEAGSYEVNFEASKLSSGIYFYTINAGGFTSTKKMILMK